MSNEYNCYRCNKRLNPGDEEVEDNAHYIRADDTREKVEKPVIVALKHSEKTRQVRDRLQEEEDFSLEQANNATARNDDVFEEEIGEEDFQKEEISTPNEAVGDPDTVRVKEELKEREEQKTALVCKSCTKDSDDVIW